MKRIRQNPGETLMEVILAITILVITLASSASLYRSALSGIGTNRDYLVASALAEEGIESVRHLVTSNKLKFPNDLDDCWTALPAVLDTDGCGEKLGDPALPDAQFYNVSQNDDGQWVFGGPYDELDLEGDDDMTGYRLKMDEDGYGYAADGIDTKFFRAIEITYVDLGGLGVDTLFVRSKVLWQQGSKVREITFPYIWPKG